MVTPVNTLYISSPEYTQSPRPCHALLSYNERSSAPYPTSSSKATTSMKLSMVSPHELGFSFLIAVIP